MGSQWQPYAKGSGECLPLLTSASGQNTGKQNVMPGDCLIYSPNGLLVVHSRAAHWVVPPTTVLRLAANVDYHVRTAGAAPTRCVVLSKTLSERMPAECRLYRMVPLLRELLESLDLTRPLCDGDHKGDLLIELLDDALQWDEHRAARSAVAPSDPRVAHICAYIHNNLDTPKTLQEWAHELGCDPRTLHRSFVQEFGMPFSQWRQQARLVAALEWLAQGRQVMDVALDLGYQTQSAFTAMFRRQMGITPTQWQDKRRLPLRPESSLSKTAAHDGHPVRAVRQRWC